MQRGIFSFKNGKALEVGTMFCIGQNYAEHAKEMGSQVSEEPVVFLKPRSAYISDGGKIILPEISSNAHHELELVVIIGKAMKSVSEQDVPGHIAGYAVGIDVTLRDLQKKAKDSGKPWAVAKGFDTSAPISTPVSAEEFSGQVPFFDLKLYLNGELKQSCNTSEMIRNVEFLLSYISGIFTLYPGDVLFTGTPHGVGKIEKGDVLEAELVNYSKLQVTAV